MATLSGSTATPGAAPTGAAAGDLSGTYPNPTVAKIGGTAVTLPLSIANGGTGSGSAGQITGTATNDAASAGNVGELISSAIAVGSPVVLTTVTGADLTSITLTAGDWDVWLSAEFIGNAATTVARLEASVSLVSATLDYTVGRGASKGFPATPTLFNTVNQETVVTGPVRLSVAINTSVFAVVFASFAVNSCSAYGMLQARRRR